MSTAIGICLIALIIVLIAAIVTLSVYLVKWLIEFTLLTRNLNDTTNIVKGEIEPILSELRQTMTNINTIAKNADNQVASVRKATAAALGLVSVFAGKFKFLSGSFMKGFLSAFNLFRKK